MSHWQTTESQDKIEKALTAQNLTSMVQDEVGRLVRVEIEYAGYYHNYTVEICHNRLSRCELFRVCYELALEN